MLFSFFPISYVCISNWLTRSLQNGIPEDVCEMHPFLKAIQGLHDSV